MKGDVVWDTIRGQCLGAHEADARPTAGNETDPAFDGEEALGLELGGRYFLGHGLCVVVKGGSLIAGDTKEVGDKIRGEGSNSRPMTIGKTMPSS